MLPPSFPKETWTTESAIIDWDWKDHPSGYGKEFTGRTVSWDAAVASLKKKQPALSAMVDAAGDVVRVALPIVNGAQGGVAYDTLNKRVGSLRKQSPATNLNLMNSISEAAHQVRIAIQRLEELDKNFGTRETINEPPDTERLVMLSENMTLEGSIEELRAVAVESLRDALNSVMHWAGAAYYYEPLKPTV